MTKYELYDGNINYQEDFHKAKALCKTVDFYSAVKIFENLAEKDHTGALIYLGDCYYKGKGVITDLEKATELFIRSGKFHFPSSGYGVMPEHYRQIEWCRKAAKNGHLIAQYKMTQHSEYSGEPDYKAAFEWYQKAAELGYAPAQYNLGWYYENGDYLKWNGVLNISQDLTKAFQWYQKAAQQGFIHAQAELARLYAEGIGVEQDKEKAAELIKKLYRKEYKKYQFKLHNMEIGDTIIIGGRRNKKRATILLTCQCNSSVNCGIATDRQCYMDAFGRKCVNTKKICFNNTRRNTVKDIFELKWLAEKSVMRNWKYFQKGEI